MHINNLYKDQTILLFKECYAMEKIHGTSAHISWKFGQGVKFFSGGTKHENFVKLFDLEALTKAFEAMGITDDREVIVFGESYGGKEQGMSHTYGPVGKFVVFDVKIGHYWLDVPKAEKVAKDLGLEFIHYVKIPTDLAAIDTERDADSVQAIRNGVGPGKIREGIVLRPLIEVTLNNGARVIAKHKRDEFRETKSPRPVVDPAKQKMLDDAQAIADEWVTDVRLQHVLQKITEPGIEKMKEVISAMVEDVLREGAGEIVDNPAVRKAIGNKTAATFKKYLHSQIGNT